MIISYGENIYGEKMNGQYVNLEDIPEIWPDWKIFKRIGGGSYGSVYEIHRQIGGHLEKAALKVIHIPQDDGEAPWLTNGFNSESGDSCLEAQVKEIQHEIVVMQQFIGYTNIVSYEDYLIHKHAKGRGWDILIRMELLTPLLKHLKSHVMSESDVLQLGLDISQALKICHEEGIIHRDIKPQNIFINQRKCFKLGDFGISKELPENLSFSSFKGTISYMAPETFAMMHTDERSDIYSLALVMYWILNNGREPFLEEGTFTEKDRRYAQRRRLTGEPLPRPVRADTGMHHVLSTALAGNPDDRYQTASQFQDALLSLQKTMEDNTGHSTMESASPINTDSMSKKRAWGKAPIPVPGKRSTALLIAAIALALVLIAGGIAGSRLFPQVMNREVQNKTTATDNEDAVHGTDISGSDAPSAAPASGETNADSQFLMAAPDSKVTSADPTAQTIVADPDEQITFPDPALEKAVRSSLTIDADKPLTRRDVMDIQSIDLSGNGKAEEDRIVDLTGLSVLSSLEDLDLRYNRISNIDEISKLTHLKRLNLENNKISDLSPVNSLQTLKKLEVAYNDISDLTPVMSMNKLELLDARYNYITSIEGIGRMMKLRTLRVGRNQITDISPVAELTNLKSLSFGYNPVEDISALYKLPMLHVLTMNGCLVNDIGPVAFMPELTNLQIKGNPIKDRSPLDQVPKTCYVEMDP